MKALILFAENNCREINTQYDRLSILVTIYIKKSGFHSYSHMLPNYKSSMKFVTLLIHGYSMGLLGCRSSLRTVSIGKRDCNTPTCSMAFHILIPIAQTWAWLFDAACRLGSATERGKLIEVSQNNSTGLISSPHILFSFINAMKFPTFCNISGKSILEILGKV